MRSAGRSRSSVKSESVKSNGHAPGSVVAQARVAVEELGHIRYCIERANAKQAAGDHVGSDPYIPAVTDGPVLSYDEYRQHFASSEVRLRNGVFKEAAVRLAERQLEEQDAAVGAGGVGGAG